MIENALEMIDKSDMTYKIAYQDAQTLSLDIDSNSKIYDVIRDVLQKYGTKDAGLCGGGFEHYPLNNGMYLAIGWNTNGPNKFHLGHMGKAF